MNSHRRISQFILEKNKERKEHRKKKRKEEKRERKDERKRNGKGRKNEFDSVLF